MSQKRFMLQVFLSGCIALQCFFSYCGLKSIMVSNDAAACNCTKWVPFGTKETPDADHLRLIKMWELMWLCINLFGAAILCSNSHDTCVLSRAVLCRGLLHACLFFGLSVSAGSEEFFDAHKYLLIAHVAVIACTHLFTMPDMSINMSINFLWSADIKSKVMGVVGIACAALAVLCFWRSEFICEFLEHDVGEDGTHEDSYVLLVQACGCLCAFIACQVLSGIVYARLDGEIVVRNCLLLAAVCGAFSFLFHMVHGYVISALICYLAVFHTAMTPGTGDPSCSGTGTGTEETRGVNTVRAKVRDARDRRRQRREAD
jgi:hypothetical protein